MQSVKEFYQGQSEDCTKQLAGISSRLKWLAFFRLLAFLMIFVPFFIFGLRGWISLPVSLAAIFVFFFLVKKHIQTERKQKEAAIRKKLAEDELLALDHKFNQFKNGSEFSDPDHFYSYDLDLFGEGSLFQFLNRTVSVGGKEKLADWLSSPDLTGKTINEKQKAIRELSVNNEWRMKFRVAGLLFEEDEPLHKEMLDWSAKGLQLPKASLIKIFLWLLPLLTFAALVPAFLGFSKLFVWSMVVVQWGLLVYFRKEISFYFQYFGRKTALLDKYLSVLKIIETSEFKAENLVGLKQRTINPEPAGKTISALKTWADRFEYRQNIIVMFLLNSLLLWDIRCMFHLWSWHNKNHSKLAAWLDVIAEFDAFVSLANYAANQSQFVYPEVVENDFVYSAKELGHPLLESSKRICNDFEITGWSKVMIITGANMAGKSTFLRTVGINLLLACTGAPVCAAKLKFTPVLLYTNMRTTDSLQKEESYFFAELKRIKRVLDLLEQGIPVFVILDEMLKGTNSVDKLNGSKALVEKLTRLKSVSLVATHDLKLSEMEYEIPGKVENRCFEIRIVNDEMIFDYKLTRGITQTMNATFLMRKMGII